MELFSLLRTKNIIAILDGDTEFGEYNGKKVAMPYLSGPSLCDISSTFGLHVDYSWGGGALSRWNYLENLMKYCEKGNKSQQLLAYLFDKDKFIDSLRGLSPQEIEESYNHITKTVIEKINGELYFGGNKLTVVNNMFVINAIDATIQVNAPKIKVIDRQYIKGLAERAMLDIESGNFDSVITKCRTLLEEVFCYVIEMASITPSDKGDIGKLHGQVKDLYGMRQDKGLDKRINELLGGLEKILNAIAEMRNKNSDAHGVGSKRFTLEEHHARLFLNSAIAMSDFILSVSEKNDTRQVVTP
jgi:hypothetical protein